MGNPYTSVSVSGYNANPPADDGSQVEANRVKWATIKTKLPDPLKTAIEAVNANVNAAFGKVIGGGGVTSTAISYQVLSTDQGKLVRASASGITITTPSATDVGSPFVFDVVNDSSGDITLDGSGSQTINGESTITLGPDEGVQLWTDGTNWFVVGFLRRTQVTPQGRLTLTVGGVPVTISDQSAVTAVYYTPHVGNLLPIPNGTVFNVREFSELTLTLVANHLASTIYDIFAFDDAGTIRIGTGPAWNNSAAAAGDRGTGAGTTQLTRLKGLLVNAVQITARNGSSTFTVAAGAGVYLGSIFMDGTNGQVSCHVTFGQNRKWGIWNAYNRVPIILRAGDSTASWNYNTATVRQSNGAAGNRLTLFSGLAEESFDIDLRQKVRVLTGTGGATEIAATIGIGLNLTTAFTTSAPHSVDRNGSVGLASSGAPSTRYVRTPTLGINNINWLEVGAGGETQTFFGVEVNGALTATWNG